MRDFKKKSVALSEYLNLTQNSLKKYKNSDSVQDFIGRTLLYLVEWIKVKMLTIKS